MKRLSLLSKLLCGIAGVAVGIILIVSDGASVLSFLTKLIGLFMLAVNVPRLILYLSMGRSGMGRIELITTLSGAIIGVTVFLLPTAAVSFGAVIAGIWFIILPILDIALSQYKTEQLKMELPKLITGVALIVLGPTALFSFMIKIFGAAVVVAALIYLIRLLTKTQ